MMLGDVTGGIATIVGLIINFIGEKRNAEQQSYEEFLLWLEHKHYKEIKKGIEESQQLSFQIKSIIGMKHAELLSKLNLIEGMLVDICSNVSGFSGLSLTINPERTLSDQAISILRQIEDNESDGVMEWKSHASFSLIGRDKSYSISIAEPRFIQDDLDKLCKFNFMKLDYSSQGNRIFYITRVASNFLKTISQ